MKNEAKVTIHNQEFILIKDYKHNEAYRQSFNLLTQKTFGFNFEDWYQRGYWGDSYRPHSLLCNDEIVANVSASPIDYMVNGMPIKAVQLGTVMTKETYRHMGLSKVLMEYVLREYEKQCELIYLYANDSVLDFYPRFGFAKAEETVHTKLFTAKDQKLSVRKLDLQDGADLELLTRLVWHTEPYSRCAMIDNPGLVMFYLTSFMAEDIYYIEELKLMAVVTFEGKDLHLVDVFCEEEVDLDLVINSLVTQTETKITLGFTPKEVSSYTAEPLREEGTTIFIKGANILTKSRFPVLSHT